DLSPVGLVASAVLTSVPSTFSWVSVNINAELKKGYHYALLLRTNGTFSWAYVNSSYVGSLGGWAYTTAWSISPNVHFCFRIPGWFGWTAGARVTLHSVTGVTLNRPAIALYPYLTSLDQSNNSTTTYYNVYGNYFAAQSFRPSSNVLSGVMLFLFTIGVTAPTDHLYIEIRRSNGSLPDMSSTGIITSGRIESSVITTVRWYDCIFNTPAYLNVSEVYWIVVYSRYSTASNSWMFYYSTANPYANGSALISNNGGSTWTPQPTWDFAFRTYSSKDERPAVAWYYQAPSGANRLRIQFIRCIPNADPSIRSNWYNYEGSSTSPNDLYRESITLETRVSMSLQPNTNAIYTIFIRGDSLQYTRIYGWNPEPGNWYGHGNFTIGSGASMAELSSAPDPYNNRVIFTFVNSTNMYSYVYYFTSNNTLVNIPSPTNMRYPTLTFIAERIFIVYQISTGLAYRYYDGTWSSEIPLYSGNYTLPNSVYRPLASSVDLIFLNGTNHILYGAIFPTGFIKIDGPFYDSRNGNPGGSGGGSFCILIDDRHFDHSFHRLNVTFFTNFSSPSSWGGALASFAWRFELGPSGLYNYGNYSNVVLYSVRLILADALGNDISVLYNDNNAGSGWMGTTVGYFFRNGIPVTLSPSTNYSLKIVFDIGCLNPMDMFLITARIDDVGIAFISYPTVLNVEFSGISDTEDWNSIWIRMVSNVSHVPANCTIRVYNFELGRYPNYGEMGYFNFTYTNTSELLREF
ncbi:MAG: hypothetical protein NZ922_03985, partial [Candidatus Methanomethyliaceae archaeon]|nr:hypothetical protein [Candidatus Methanomethyliaceae archaeon]